MEAVSRKLGKGLETEGLFFSLACLLAFDSYSENELSSFN